jgi:hypothetical protein
MQVGPLVLAHLLDPPVLSLRVLATDEDASSEGSASPPVVRDQADEGLDEDGDC